MLIPFQNGKDQDGEFKQMSGQGMGAMGLEEASQRRSHGIQRSQTQVGSQWADCQDLEITGDGVLESESDQQRDAMTIHSSPCRDSSAPHPHPLRRRLSQPLGRARK